RQQAVRYRVRRQIDEKGEPDGRMQAARAPDVDDACLKIAPRRGVLLHRGVNGGMLRLCCSDAEGEERSESVEARDRNIGRPHAERDTQAGSRQRPAMRAVSWVVREMLMAASSRSDGKVWAMSAVRTPRSDGRTRPLNATTTSTASGLTVPVNA